MSFELIDALYRSRKTLLKLLERQGYNVAPFERFSPREIELMMNNKGSLDFVAEKGDEKKQYARVIYTAPRFNKTKMESFIEEMKLDEDEIEASEFILMITDPVVDAHDASALKHWIKNKIRVRYFEVVRLTHNPLDWEYGPQYEIIPAEKHAELLKSLRCTSKSNLPIIRYHFDHSARCLGLVPGDIVKVIRPSMNAGESIVYRVCAP
jgi:DNA-directed RNA polymerase subunit H (RpoH/RPB5)